MAHAASAARLTAPTENTRSTLTRGHAEGEQRSAAQRGTARSAGCAVSKWAYTYSQIDRRGSVGRRQGRRSRCGASPKNSEPDLAPILVALSAHSPHEAVESKDCGLLGALRAQPQCPPPLRIQRDTGMLILMKAMEIRIGVRILMKGYRKPIYLALGVLEQPLVGIEPARQRLGPCRCDAPPYSAGVPFSFSAFAFLVGTGTA